MPIYEYQCRRCRKEFEQLVLSDSEEVVCPHCKGARVRKLVSVCAFSVGSNFKSTSSSGCSSCKPTATSCSACSVKH